MNAYFKTVFRSVRRSLARFIAIFAIIALGVGFFAGLKLTMPSFVKTGNSFVKETQLFDFRLLSTIGFDEDDISKLRSITGVRKADGAVYYDFVVGNSGVSTQVSTIRMHSLTDGINIPKLVSGRMPESPNEVVADEYRLGNEWLGRTLYVSEDNSKDTKDALNYDEYVIVGLVRSPYYMNFQRSSTDVGVGTIEFYCYAPKEAFDFEYYTEAFVKYDSDHDIFSDEYDEFVNLTEKLLEKDLDVIIDDRFDGILEEAYQDLYDARDEFEDKRIEAASELDDARQELSEAAVELIDAKVQLADAAEELEDARRELDDAAEQLENAQGELYEAERQIASGRAEIDQVQAEINSNKATLEQSLEDASANLLAVNTGLEQAASTKEGLEANLPAVNAQISSLTEQIADLEARQEAGEDVADELDAARTGLDQAQQNKSAIEAGIASCEASITELTANKETLLAAKTEIENGFAAIETAQAELDKGKAKLEDAEREYRNGLARYSRGMSEYSTGLADYRNGREEYDAHVAEYNDGFTEYYDGLREYLAAQSDFSREMGNYSRQLEYGFRAVEDVKKPDTYVLGRDTNVGYMSFDNDSKIVDGISKVFPVFFFAIAALVCSTTMSRMVADERTQIGTMRALGYSDFAIVMKYVIYSGSASVSGCILGYFTGTKVFPYVIWEVYRMMYGFADVEFQGSVWIFLLSLGVSVICSIGVTVATCAGELNGMPAEMIRPKAPAAGKRILLEKMPFIWTKMQFLHKVSFRNVFRFKKRMWMMIIGIAGCASLLITGFGLTDSINDIVDLHYDKIMKYDLSVLFDNVKESEIREAMMLTNEETGADLRYAVVQSKAMSHTGSDMVRDVNVIISNDPDITDFVCPRDTSTGETLPWPAEGTIAISSKLAEKNGIKEGDSITLTYDDGARSITCNVDYIFENYIFHYAFISSNTFEALSGERYKPDQVFVQGQEGVSITDYAGRIGQFTDVSMWSLTSDSRASFAETVKQMNAVVILVIICAAFLAFIVMFNLNNINITERIREIATLKVMGFNMMETGSYVFRENIMLVIIGFIFGIPLGILLHRFVIAQIEMDTVTFECKILPLSYLWSVLFVILFTVIVDLVMRRKIDRIDMAESLKSVE
ncbi:MAG: hypothetical protein K6A80_01355 [Saccharofermentans sp.]|nr:hypothetical protein [Saccharofermentans sp.]